MFLKRLDTVGFKSFADRVSVEFVPGVTAVVGPNGSGKSNITDAIRWVLGEQSARSLRGSKMEDIIFSGSDTRNALNFAEVSLVLDNEDTALPLDYQEVSITRRVYRSGESEFFINQQSCRLKDIIDLFMDSGLGKEAFSIISQGKVEEILSSKPEERRSIFEEAAGVLKYKQRKKKAEMKLSETQENLYRVEDIIYELDGQLEPLKEQATIAQTYLEKKDELEKNEVALLVTEIEQLNYDWKNLLQEIDVQNEEALHKQSDIQQEEAKIEKEKYEIQRIDENIEQMQAKLLTLTQELENIEGRKRLFHERWKHYEENKDKLSDENAKLTQKLKEIGEQLDQEQQKLTSILNERDQNKKQLVRLEEKLGQSKESIEEKIEELKSEYIEKLNEQAAKRNESQSIERHLEQNQAKKGKMTSRFQDLINDRKEIDKEKQKIEQALNTEQQKLQNKEQAYNELKEEINKGHQVIQAEQTKLNQGSQLIHKLRSKKEMLEEMKEDFAGFFHGVKAVLKARDRKELEGIFGAVAEKIEIPTDYVQAMETALGGQAQHVIVESEPHARKAINWLKKTNNGRATFLPLSSMQPKRIQSNLIQQVERHQGYVGIASQLIKYEEKYAAAIQSLLGNIVITKTLKDANEIAGLLHRRYRIVTLEGDVVNPGGSMTGGAKKKNNNSLFTREKELKQVIEKLSVYERKSADFEQEINQLILNTKQKEDQLSELEQEVSRLKTNVDNLREAVREVEVKLSNINNHLSLYDQEQEQYSEEEQDLHESKKVIKHQLEKLEEETTSLQAQIDELTSELNTQQQSSEKLQQEHNSLQITLAELDTNVRNQREKVNSLSNQQSELIEQQQQVNEELEELEKMKEQGQTVSEIDQEITSKRLEKQQTEYDLKMKREERQQRNQKTADVENELKEKNRSLNQLRKHIQEKEVKANRMDVELDNRLGLLQEEYMLSYEKAKEKFGKTDDLEKAKQTVKGIKRSIEQLGNVNLGAIDEYERVKERYDFLTTQQQDLLDAKETLYSVIHEMDTEMVNRFEGTFVQIQKEFVEVFKALFGGGRADLTLTNPSDLLETGVDIVAQPPGKKLQNLGLLSGGERALTAIALLFAILRVRPVPFCVLDEVEAALDDANVNRFAQYLKQFSANTQFIVITHRKGTMEEADVLYGVTMQESGVSKLVSVRLEETEQMVNA
ncbi:chromosome segregation protein SMC [Salinibacillus xinjiangensis]|uniref:Chromosome partition protein Smc n=1 Tax=Salinibacillus xinjiangensis TaxID=1229268 RepID=A0A6G1X3H3_9BACI|nr:chromosome segregation protein SMC [Salinibacillus xinjiangensis]MRG85430.1 chromosome segregation protein SMC [Salinibacillus xinjiangensis]